MTTQSFNQDAFCENVRQPRNWVRLLYMLIFAVLLQLAGMVMWVLCALQFLFLLGSGRDNAQIRSLAKSVTRFIEQALMYVSFNTDAKPFPFSSWESSGEWSEAGPSAADVPTGEQPRQPE